MEIRPSFPASPLFCDVVEKLRRGLPPDSRPFRNPGDLRARTQLGEPISAAPTGITPPRSRQLNTSRLPVSPRPRPAEPPTAPRPDEAPEPDLCIRGHANFPPHPFFQHAEKKKKKVKKTGRRATDAAYRTRDLVSCSKSSYNDSLCIRGNTNFPSCPFLQHTRR